MCVILSIKGREKDINGKSRTRENSERLEMGG